ncbi:E3 ubiquitin-protein transferase rmnd5a [Cichlidogyrus casuarinus]|uniref:E3 ubiquitin-protein transferase rmnd5a n=1 Tax=Cichlidogyrus casuarinus TaxID=1844966 RepID=A0ABD2QPP2_9PLAT
MDQYLHLVIVEHLFRTGQNKVALKLAEEAKLPLSEVGYQKFRTIYDLVGAIHNGHLQPAKAWLQENRDRLGDKVMHYEYAIAKLEFLSSVQQKSRDAKEILNFARKLAPYASEYRSDFEHLMGSLAFLGRSLDETPYTDLILSRTVDVAREDDSMEVDDESQTQLMFCEEQDYIMAFNKPLMINYQPSDDFSAPVNGTDLLMRVAAMFHTAACRQLGFSHIDPLFTAFSAGCRVLPKLHELKHAIESISKYSTDANTLPISVKLDPIAYRHNIFHCPVIKEMNHHPVRLFCGHAISRDAFNSLASSERSRIKCPYCPIDTQRNQVKDLKF